MEKPREWKILKCDNNGDRFIHGDDTNDNEFVHVIEKSAYDELVRALDDARDFVIYIRDLSHADTPKWRREQAALQLATIEKTLSNLSKSENQGVSDE